MFLKITLTTWGGVDSEIFVSASILLLLTFMELVLSGQ